MRYLSIYFDFKPLLWIDLHEPKRESVIDAIYYIDKYETLCVISNYKNIMSAKFKRTGTHSVESQSRLIHLSDAPKRLSPDEAIPFLEGLLKRGKDIEKRTMHPNSLCNLKPGERFTSECRPNKPRLLSDEQLLRAIELRSNGCSWRKTADRLSCNVSTLRTSLRRRMDQQPK